LDQCFEKAKAILNVDNISKSQDFFETKEKLSVTKFDYYKKNPDLYKIVREAFYSTPNELRSDIEEKYGAMIAKKNKIEEQLFEKVPLREGVDRGQAFKLVRLALDYFDNKYLSEMLDNNDLDETYFQNFIDERNSYFDMIRYGIQK
jgi:hypothetical protein